MRERGLIGFGVCDDYSVGVYAGIIVWVCGIITLKIALCRPWRKSDIEEGCVWHRIILWDCNGSPIFKQFSALFGMIRGTLHTSFEIN